MRFSAKSTIMNALTIIAICLVGSAILQGIGFYVYTEIYKKRFFKSYSQADAVEAKIYNLAGQKSTFSNFSKLQGKGSVESSKVKQAPVGKSLVDVPQPNSGKVPVKAHTSKTIIAITKP